jgi:short-subunit dehydrogenase
VSNYLEGLRYRFASLKFPVVVTDVQPGFVDTAMAKAEHKFWVATPEKAATQIVEAVHRGKTLVYVTRRWRLIAWFVKAVPDWLAVKLSG